mmetsp:Transcript_911/g.1852  ORF Transcript_911/g.1852 Transcript_911/m.1852 type:complete len:226 (+) Transcript_911:158-835(+)
MIVNHFLGIHNSNIHASLQNGMMQKHSMDGLSNLHDTTEAKREVGDSSTNFHIRALLLDLLGGIDEVNTIVVVLFEPCPNSQDIGIKDDILRWEMYLLHQNVIGALANADLVLLCCCLTFFVKSHHHNCCSVLPQQGGVLNEQLLSNLEGDRVHNALSLAPLETSQHNLKLGGIKHERHFGNLWISHSNLDKLLHGSQTIQETIININVNYMGTILHLLFGNVHG